MVCGKRLVLIQIRCGDWVTFKMVKWNEKWLSWKVSWGHGIMGSWEFVIHGVGAGEN